MKKNSKLVLSKETLRALTQEQLPGVNGGAASSSATSYDPACFYSEATWCRCP